MFRFGRLLRAEQQSGGFFWDTPVAEHMHIFNFWKRMSNNKRGNMTWNEAPRTLQGYVEANQPRTDEVLRWYPYKNEITVDGTLKPTFSDILHTYYWPKSFTDEERIKYKAEKTGRSEAEITDELFKMRRLRLQVAQNIRMKLKSRVWRQPLAPDGVRWKGQDRRYLVASLGPAYSLGMAYYTCEAFEPFVVYSPYYQFGTYCDMILHKPVKNALQYLICEVVIHRSIPQARIPGVEGMPKFPIDGVEPCEFEEIRLRLAVTALLLRRENYVVDNNIDGGHRYLGGIIHLYETGDEENTVTWNIVPVDVDLDLAEKWLLHYKETILAPAN